MFSLSTLQMSKAPPVEPSEQVADQAGPHECKENLLNIAGNSTNLHHLMLCCLFFIYFFQIHHVVDRLIHKGMLFCLGTNPKTLQLG